MRTSRQMILGLAAASLLFGFSGCKKAAETQDKAAEAIGFVETALNLTDWNKSEVNSLLQFVPADTPFVLATTREFDNDSPWVKHALEYTKKTTAETRKVLKAHKDDQDIQLQMKYLDWCQPLIDDYAKNAPEFGLDPKHSDMIAYLDNTGLVFKLTTSDSAKMKSKLEALAAIFASSVTTAEIKAEEAVFTEYTIALSKYEEDTIKVYVNYGSQTVTAVLFADANMTSKLVETLKPAASPISKDALGKVDSTVSTLGFVSNEAALAKAFSIPKLRQFVVDKLDIKNEAACESELKAIAADYPRYNLVFRSEAENQIKVESTLLIKDKDTIATLKSLRGAGVSVVSDKTLANLSLNIDAPKLLDAVLKMTEKLSNAEYKCEPLALIAKETASLKTIPPEVTSMAGLFSSLSIAADNIDLTNLFKDRDNYKGEGIEAAVALSGSSIGAVLPELLKPASGRLKVLGDIKPDMKAPVALDLKALDIVDFPLIFNVYMTDKALVAGTPNYDVNAIASTEPKINENFFDFRITPAFYTTLFNSFDGLDNDSVKEVKDLMHVLLGTMGSQVYMSVNDEGIVLNSVMTY